MDSTAELLFKITANSDEAQASLDQFRTVMGDDLAFVTESFEQFGEKAIQQQLGLAAALDKATASETAQVVATEALAEAHGHAVSQMQATSGAIRLLEGRGHSGHGTLHGHHAGARARNAGHFPCDWGARLRRNHRQDGGKSL